MKKLLPVLLVAASAVFARDAGGVVVDAGGAPVAGATVFLKSEQDNSVRSWRTQGDGRFRFVGLSADLDYTVQARVGSHETKQATISRFDKDDKMVELKFRVPATQLR